MRYAGFEEFTNGCPLLRWLRFYRSRYFSYALVISCTMVGWGLSFAYTSGLALGSTQGVVNLATVWPVLGLAASLVLMWRLSHTVGAGVAIVALSALTPSASPALWSILFLLGMRYPRPRFLLGLSGAVVALAVQIYIYELISPRPHQPDDLALFVSFALVMLIGAGVTGYVVGLHQLRNSSTARSLSAALEREDAVIAATRASERLQLAEEIHDVLAQHLGRLTLHANALQRAPLTPDERNDTIATIAGSARGAVRELSNVLAVLENVRAENQVATYADDIGDIYSQLTQRGLEIQPSEPPVIDFLPVVDQRTIERFLREALTNVLQHADTPLASVSCRVSASEIMVAVTSSAEKPSTPLSAPNRGTQLSIFKLRERARLRGGNIVTRVSSSTFEIRLVVART